TTVTTAVPVSVPTSSTARSSSYRTGIPSRRPIPRPCRRQRRKLVGQRTGVINQIRAFLLERGIAARQGLHSLRAELPAILATRSELLLPRMWRFIEDLAGAWRRLDARIEGLSSEIETLARQDKACERLMTVPGIGPLISTAMVAAIGAGDAFSKGRDFGA